MMGSSSVSSVLSNLSLSLLFINFVRSFLSSALDSSLFSKILVSLLMDSRYLEESLLTVVSSSSSSSSSFPSEAKEMS